ncbi:hypothetical protein F4678DRAFT_464577 [Xylaria arbuscula]|nr:hypothetical protein F4678DRAFT_464577 [Xylaria arbuscula]
MECPGCHRPMISLATVTEAMVEYKRTANKYISCMSAIFATKVWEEFRSKNDTLQHHLHLLSTIDSEYVSKTARDLEKERADCWADLQRLAPSSSTQEEKSEVKVQGDQMKGTDQQQDNKAGTSSDEGKHNFEPLILREAREAVAKYIEICEEEIKNRSYDSWFILSCGLEIIDRDYQKTRDVVKKAIMAANDKNADESQNVNKAGVEQLLKELRKIWEDARYVFVDAWDEDADWGSDMDEEMELGLL